MYFPARSLEVATGQDSAPCLAKLSASVNRASPAEKRPRVYISWQLDTFCCCHTPLDLVAISHSNFHLAAEGFLDYVEAVDEEPIL